MAFTLNRRLAQLVDSSGQLNTGKIPNDYISSDHIADNVITTAMLHSGFTLPTSSLSSIDTDNVSEGSSNLYYTDARVGTYISGNRTFGNITTTGYIAGPATFTIDPAAVGDNTGTVVIAGNLQVDGTTTTINSTTMTVDDLNLTLASGAANAAAANGAGITVDGASATITYDGTNDEWDFNKDIKILGPSNADGPRFYMMEDSNNGAFIKYDGSTNKGELGGLTSSGENTVMTWSRDSSQVVFNENSIDMDFRVESNGNENMLFIDGGNNRVGIGTNNLTRTFEVNSGTTNASAVFQSTDSTSYISFKDSGGQVAIGNTAGEMRFWTGDAVTETMRIDANGYVGIGTDNPTQMLHISHSTDGEGIQIDHTTVGGYNDIILTTKQNDGNQKVMHRLRSDMIDGTSGGEDSQLDIIGMTSGSEKLGIRLDRNTSTYISSQTSIHFQGHADTAGANYQELGSWTAGNGSRITIRINGAIGFSNNFDHAGETVIHGTISNNSDFEGFFYGVGSNSTATAVAISSPSTGVYKIFVLPGAYGSYEAYVHVSSGTVWTPKTSSNNTGSSSLPTGAVGLQSEFGVNISGTRKLLVNSSGNLELSNGLNSTAGTVQYSDGGSSFDSSNANGYPVFRQTSGSAQIGFERTGAPAGLGYIGADGDNVFAIWDSSFNRKVIVSQSGNVDVNTGRIKVINSGTDAYFFEGVRSGGNTTLRMYDNNNNLYIDSYTNMSLRCNQTGGGSGGHIYLSGGNVGIGVSGAPQDKLHVESGSSDEITTFRVSSSGQVTIARNHSTGPSITSYMGSGIPRFDFTRNGVVETRVASNQDTWFNASTQGNVGIGTSSPSASIDVRRNTNTVNNIDSLGFDVVGSIGNAASNPGNHYTSGLRIYQGSGTVGSGLGVMYLGADNGNATPENDYTGQISAPDGMSGGLRLNTFTNDAKIRFYTKHSSTIALRMDIDNEGIDVQGIDLYASASASLTTTATDFYVNSTGAITTGTYILRIILSGGGWYSETHTGIMRWYSGTTNNPTGDTIYLTGMGHANTVGTLNARVLRKYSNTNTHSIQLWLSSGSSSNHTITMQAAKIQD